MDPNTGKIVHLEKDDDANKRGLVPIDPRELARVRKMNMKRRMRWAADQLALKRHPSAPSDGETEADIRKNRNARKRARKARR